MIIIMQNDYVANYAANYCSSLMQQHGEKQDVGYSMAIVQNINADDLLTQMFIKV